MKKHVYGIFNIESSNFSLDDEERVIYNAEINFAHSGASYYRIETTWFRYLILKFRFWRMRRKNWSKVHIRRL